MRRLALVCSMVAGGACGDDSGTTDSLGSNSADDSASAGTDTGNDDANDSGSSGSASVSDSTSADGSSGAADSAGSSGGEDGSSSAAGSDSGGDETFACGDALMCLVASQYCQETIGGAKKAPPQYQCMELPPGCQPEPSCDCLVDVGCAQMCQMSGAGLQVTCLAP